MDILDKWQKLNDSNLDNESMEETPVSEELKEDLKQEINYGDKAWLLNEILASFNNEGAYYSSGWLYIWPDECSKEDCDFYFGTEEEYKDLEDSFKRIYKSDYRKDGFYKKPSEEALKLAHEFDAELGLPAMEILEEKLKKENSLSFFPDPEKSVEFFNHVMGADTDMQSAAMPVSACETTGLAEGSSIDNVFGVPINGTLKELDARQFVNKVLEQKRSLHTNRLDQDTDNRKVLYVIVLDLMGFYEEDAKLWVDVIKETWERNQGVDADDPKSYSGEISQERVLMEYCGDGEDKWDKAVEIIDDFKKQHVTECLKEEKHVTLEEEVEPLLAQAKAAREACYRKYAGIPDNVQITAENLDEKALTAASCYLNYDADFLRDQLLGDK